MELKLDNQTLSVLEQMIKIHQSISFYADESIYIKTVDDTCLAKFDPDEKFPVDFHVFDLKEFIQAIKLFDEPILDFNDNGTLVTIKNSDDTASVRYASSEEEVIKSYPKQTFEMPEHDFEFMLDGDTLKKALKGLGVLSNSHIGFRSDGESLEIVSFKKDSNSDEIINPYSIDIGDCPRGEPFFAYFTKECFTRLYEGTYDIKIATGFLANFQHRDLALDYYQTFEEDSEF